MSFAGNFHPQWGYLVPARSFIGTVRTALIATAVGLVAGAVTVLSLVERRPADASQSVAARALVRAVDTDAISAQPAPPKEQAANQQAGKPAGGGNDKPLPQIALTVSTAAQHLTRIEAPAGAATVPIPSPRPKAGQSRLATSGEPKTLAAIAAAGEARAENKAANKASGSRSAPRTNIIQIFGDYGPADHTDAAAGTGYREQRWGGLFPEIFSIR